jgi:RNA polymerase sigma-70 factor (ECF subfamily)
MNAHDMDLFADINLSYEFDTKISGNQIQNILAKIPIKYRDVLVLKFIEDKSYEEISDILQVPLGTVATNINRAKKKFQAVAISTGIDF